MKLNEIVDVLVQENALITVVCNMVAIFSKPLCVYPCSAETGIFQGKQMNTMIADALALYPGHQQSWYWLCITNNSICSMRKFFKNLCWFSVSQRKGMEINLMFHSLNSAQTGLSYSNLDHISLNFVYLSYTSILQCDTKTLIYQFTLDCIIWWYYMNSNFVLHIQIRNMYAVDPYIWRYHFPFITIFSYNKFYISDFIGYDKSQQTLAPMIV